MSGRPALDISMESPASDYHITDWAWTLVKEGRGMDIIDKRIRDSGRHDIMERFVLVGLLCAHVSVTVRPTIREALKMLEGDSDVPEIPDRPLPFSHINFTLCACDMDSEPFLPSANEANILPPIYIRDQDKRPKVAHNHFSKDIPIISLLRPCVVEQIKRACEEWGFFQLVDHGVLAHLINSMLHLSQEFFTLPQEEKLNYDMTRGKQGGFVVSSHLQGESILDWREIITYFSFPIHARNYTCCPEKPDD
eukprot:Gb_33840 [translate_table: standard]